MAGRPAERAQAACRICVQQLRHEDLYDSYDFSPSYEYFFTPNFSLQGLFSYVRDTYVYSAVAADDKTGQDAITRTWELNPNFYFNNRKDILSFYVNREDSNAKNNVYTYDAYNWAVSYFKSFNLFRLGYGILQPIQVHQERLQRTLLSCGRRSMTEGTRGTISMSC